MPPYQLFTALYHSMLCGMQMKPSSGQYQVWKTALNQPEKKYKPTISKRGTINDIATNAIIMGIFYNIIILKQVENYELLITNG